MLEYVPGLTKVCGHDVVVIDDLNFDNIADITKHILLDRANNEVSFKLKKDDNNACPIQALIGFTIEIVYAKSAVYMDAKDDEGIEMKEKYHQAINNLMLAFRHLKIIEDKEEDKCTN